MSERWLFEILPYFAIAVAIAGWARRFVWHVEPPVDSGQKPRGWARQAWSLGLIGLVAGHLLGLLIPAQILAWNLSPLRLLILESSGLMFGTLALWGFVFGGPGGDTGRVIDVILRALIAVCLVSGIIVALTQRWGSVVYSAIWVPYLWSLVHLDPVAARVAGLPWIAHVHMTSAFATVAVLPFSSFRLLGFRRRPGLERASDKPGARGWTTALPSSR